MSSGGTDSTCQKAASADSPRIRSDQALATVWPSTCSGSRIGVGSRASSPRRGSEDGGEGRGDGAGEGTDDPAGSPAAVDGAGAGPSASSPAGAAELRGTTEATASVCTAGPTGGC